MKTSIADVLSSMDKGVIAVSPGDSVHKAIEVMYEHSVGGVLVMDGEKIAGIFTERDCMYRVILKDLPVKETLVKDVMTSKVAFITTGDSIGNALFIMTENNFRHMPVMDEGKTIGVICVCDLVKRLLRDQKAEIEYLADYIQQS